MVTNTDAQHALREKIGTLPPEQVAEVETFVDFLCLRLQERSLTHAAATMSEDVFRQVWENPDDAAYDRL